MRILQDFARTGQFLPDPYTRTMLVGQIWLSRPIVEIFGVSIGALQVAVAVLGALGLRAAVTVLERFLPFPWAVFAVLVLGLGPIYGSASVTYMSDVPSLAIQFIALYFATRAMESTTQWRAWLAASLLTSFVAFTIRDHAAGALIAIVLAFVWVRRDLSNRDRLSVVTAGFGWVLIAGALFRWRKNLSSLDGVDHVGLASLRPSLTLALQAVLTLGALLLPVAAALFWRPRLWSERRPLVLAVIVGIAVVAHSVVEPGPLLRGNYFTHRGSYAETVVGVMPMTSSPAMWQALMAASLLAFAMLTGRLLGGLMRLWTEGVAAFAARASALPAALVLSALYGVVTVAVAIATGVLSNGSFFDRYLMPAVPFLAAWAIYSGLRHTDHVPDKGGHRLSAGIAIGVMAGWSLVGLNQVDVAATLDGAKWTMGETLEGSGYSPDETDAGLEWFGLHQSGEVRSPGPSPRGDLGFWLGLFDAPRVCVVATYAGHEVLEGGPVVATVEASSLFGHTYVLTARTVAVNCPTTA